MVAVCQTCWIATRTFERTGAVPPARPALQCAWFRRRAAPLLRVCGIAPCPSTALLVPKILQEERLPRNISPLEPLAAAASGSGTVFRDGDRAWMTYDLSGPGTKAGSAAPGPTGPAAPSDPESTAPAAAGSPYSEAGERAPAFADLFGGGGGGDGDGGDSVDDESDDDGGDGGGGDDDTSDGYEAAG